MILPIAVLLFSMVSHLYSLETPFRLDNCTTPQLSIGTILYSASSANTKVCAPISSAWSVGLTPSGAPLFNASLPNVLCVYGSSSVYFNGSIGFASNRSSLTFCRASDGVCVEVDLFASPGIYTVNKTFIAGGANTRPLWMAFGIINPDLHVCDSAQLTPINVIPFVDSTSVNCSYNDNYPVQNILLPATSSLSPGTHIVLLSNGLCGGPGVKSDPLTIIVMSSATPTPSMASTALAGSSSDITTTSVTMTTSATPSVSSTITTANDALPIGIGVGVGGTVTVLVVVGIAATLLFLRSCLHTGKTDMQGNSAPEEIELDGTKTEYKPEPATRVTAEPVEQAVTHYTPVGGGNTYRSEVEPSPSAVMPSFTKSVVVIGDEDGQWYHELANNLAQIHQCTPNFLAWKELASSSGGDVCQTIYRLYTHEDCEHVYVVWKGPLEHQQSSDFHSVLCELETRPAMHKLGLVQMGAPVTCVKNCGHTKRIALTTSDATDVYACARTIYEKIHSDHQTTTDPAMNLLREIKYQQEKQNVMLENLSKTAVNNTETLQNVNTNVKDLVRETAQNTDALQNLDTTEIFQIP